MYDSVKVIFDSALQDDLISLHKNKKLSELVIPELIAFRACMKIRDIQIKKGNIEKTLKRRAERKGLTYPPEEEEEEKVEEVKISPRKNSPRKNKTKDLTSPSKIKEL